MWPQYLSVPQCNQRKDRFHFFCTFLGIMEAYLLQPYTLPVVILCHRSAILLHNLLFTDGKGNVTVCMCVCWGLPDVGVFRHQCADLQEQQRGVGQLEHLGDGGDGSTETIRVFPLHATTDQCEARCPHVYALLPPLSGEMLLTAASFLKRNLNWSASLIILSAPSRLSSAFLKVILFCITALMYSTTTRRRASLVISCTRTQQTCNS